MEDKKLIDIAEEARKKAYAPYSHFCVGAALLCEDGSVYTGCNIENASFSPTCCAERVAIFKAVSDGKTRFSAIAIVGGKRDGEKILCYPCGVCRQTICEFCDGDMRIITSDGGQAEIATLGELLPNRFKF